MREGAPDGGAARVALTAVAAAGAALATRSVLARNPVGGRHRWTRQNYRDRPVDLFGGPAAAAGALTAALAVGSGGRTRPRAAAAAVAVAGSAALGLYDDLAGATHARGLRGHLAALRRGEVTTGIVKLAGLAALGLAAAPPHRAAPGGATPGRVGRLVDRAVDGALISGTANLVNLLDLRPGRSLKVVGVAAVPLLLGRDAATVAAAGTAGTAMALLPGDLQERHMLGDCGANALGALLGWATAGRAGRGARAVALATVVGATLASERVSFSAAIDGNPALSALDQWGRRPP